MEPDTGRNHKTKGFALQLIQTTITEVEPQSSKAAAEKGKVYVQIRIVKLKTAAGLKVTFWPLARMRQDRSQLWE